VLKELADGVYIEDSFEGGNVGLILTGRGAILVDTPMLPPQARQWQATLERMGAEKVYGIVNTDYHPEHFLGNHFFMPTRVFGHELALKPLSKYKNLLEQLANLYREKDPLLAEELAQVAIHPPEIYVEDRVTLYLGRKVEVLYLEGHTPASLGVYLPKERILFAGDNITNNEHPSMYQANSEAWLRTLKRIEEMDVDIIVPGVGNPCSKDVISPLYDYIAEMRRRVNEMFEAGASRRECVEKVGMLDWFPIPEGQSSLVKRRRRENVERVYTEIRLAHRKR